jgi:hypothetical protein
MFGNDVPIQQAWILKPAATVKLNVVVEKIVLGFQVFARLECYVTETRNLAFRFSFGFMLGFLFE